MKPLLRLIDPMVQRSIRLRNTLANAMTIGVRGMVIDGDRRVFLVRHGYTPGWHMPGGAVDAGETVLEALVRELKEEGNLDVAVAALHAIYRNPRFPRDHVVLFVVSAFEQPHPPRPNREIVETGFFALDRLPEATTPATRRRLAEVLDGTPPARDW
jgi:ADP-ribose pyrophosphatase YjhB (NUDIX family)